MNDVAAEAKRLGFDVVAEVGQTFILSGHGGSATFALSDDGADVSVLSAEHGEGDEWLPFVWLRYAIEGRCFDVDRSLFWFQCDGELTRMHLQRTCGMSIKTACEVA